MPLQTAVSRERLRLSCHTRPRLRRPLSQMRAPPPKRQFLLQNPTPKPLHSQPWIRLPVRCQTRLKSLVIQGNPRELKLRRAQPAVWLWMTKLPINPAKVRKLAQVLAALLERRRTGKRASFPLMMTKVLVGKRRVALVALPPARYLPKQVVAQFRV